MFPATIFRPLYLIITAAVVAVGSWLAGATVLSQFEMYIAAPQTVTVVDQTIPVSIRVRADEATNVFSGTLQFDSAYFTVDRIDYNTSLADIWAVEPWYNRGDGTVTFAGGTTRPGGFTGDESLLTVTFRALQTGSSALEINGATILRHNGLGTQAPATEPLDVVFTIEPAVLADQTVLSKSTAGPTIEIVPERPNVDLNNDGQITTADYSIFMVHLTSQNLRSDFNQDGRVTISDLSILSRMR